MNPSLEGEELVLLAHAGDDFPRKGGRKIHRSTPFRWANPGLKVGDERVRLETIRVGGLRYTSRQAVRRFVARTTAAWEPSPAPAIAPPLDRRQIRVEAELERMGL